MEDHGEIGHLTKFDAFSMNRNEVIDLEIHTNASNCQPASPKTI